MIKAIEQSRLQHELPHNCKLVDIYRQHKKHRVVYWGMFRTIKTLRTEKSFRNLIKSTRNQIAFTIFRLIWNQTDVRLDLDQSENGKYNLIAG